MYYLSAVRNAITGMIEVYRCYGDSREEIVGVFFFLEDALIEFPTLIDWDYFPEEKEGEHEEV